MFLNFVKTVYRKARLKVVALVVFSVVAGALEGIGFALFIPLVKIITTSSEGVVQNEGTSFLFKTLLSSSLGKSLFLLLGFIVFVTAAKSIFLYFQKIFTTKISMDFEVDLKKDISASVFASDWKFYLNQKIGTLANAIGNASRISGMAFTVTAQLCAEILNVVFYCIVGLLISWESFLMSIVAGAIYVYLSKNLVFKTRAVGKEEVEISNDAQRCILEDFMGIKFIKGSNIEDQRRAKLFALIEKLGFLNIQREKYIAILNTFPELVLVFIMCFIFYVSYTYFNVPGESLLVLLAVLYRFNRRLMSVQTLRQRLLNYLPSYDLCMNIIDKANELKEKTGSIKFETLKDSIEFKEVFFSYTDQPVLQATTFKITKNSFTAFLGKSGSGKTTILDLVIGLLRAEKGIVFIDEKRIEKYDIFSWRKRIGYVPQEAFLINGTILENIKMSNLEATMEEVVAASKASHADEFIEKLPDSYETFVGDRGIKLSGGQRQRIALARALVRKPDILILDEATSSLDNRSEKMIQGALGELKGKLTIIVVAHRLTTVEEADIVYIVDSGKIMDSGRLEDLRVSSEIFKDIYLKG